MGYYLWLFGRYARGQKRWPCRLALWWHVPSQALFRFIFIHYTNYIFIALHLEKVQQDQSSMTKVFARLKKAVDKLHFRGHRGSYCQENCDPFKLPELKGVNTPVCEQTFSWMNKYRNCRNMNEARFFWFFLYLIDLRNLDKENKVIPFYWFFDFLELSLNVL